MKKPAALFALLLVLTLCLSAVATAEEPVLLWEADSISSLSNSSSAVKVYNRRTGYGVYALDGKTLLPCQYTSISDSYCVPGYYVVSIADGVNKEALVNNKNVILTEETYGDIKMINADWFIGFVLEATTKEDYDYRSWGSEHYLISRCDVYYTGSGKVGSLSRVQYKDAIAHGDYLLVKDRTGGLQLYDKHLHPVSSAFEYYSNGDYYIQSAGKTTYVTHRITGERIASGYSDVSNDTFNGEVLEVYSSLSGGYGLIDLKGNVLIPCAYGTYINECKDSRYAEVQQQNAYGLSDLEKRTFVIPCEYADILTPDYKTLNYRGYFLVEKDGKLGYVDESGKVTCNITYSKSAMTKLGCTMYAADLDGTYKLVAADGVITPLAGVTEISEYHRSPDGYYLVVKNREGLWGIMDWHGNLIVDYCGQSEYDFDFVDVTHFIFDDKAMYELK